MADEGRYAQKWQEWASQLGGDIDLVFALSGNEAIAPQGRRFLAAAISYVLTQLDLIPDHERAGAVDDALVLRVAAALAAEHAGALPTKESTQLARLSNDDEEIRAALGDALFARLRRYVIDLCDKPVRGRTVDQIMNDARAREDVQRELEQSKRRLKDPTALAEAEAAALEVSVKSYLQMKLK
jgi:uncharacterized membrane protein YkvA (DUF1232 family)